MFLINILLLIWFCINGNFALKENENSNDVLILAVVESPDTAMTAALEKAFKDQKSGINFILDVVLLESGEEYNCFRNICHNLMKGVSLILDLSWKGWAHAENVATTLGVPYQRVDVTIRQFVHAADDYLQNRNATDAALIFQNEPELDQALLYLVGNSVIRLLVLEGLNSTIGQNLKNMRPMPSYYIIYGTSSKIREFLEVAFKQRLTATDSKWLLVQEDFNEGLYDRPTDGSVTVIRPLKDICNNLFPEKSGKCDNTRIPTAFAQRVFQMIIEIFGLIKKESKFISIQHDCNDEKDLPNEIPRRANETFTNNLNSLLGKDFSYITNTDNVLRLKLKLNIAVETPTKEQMAVWSTQAMLAVDPLQLNKIVKRTFKVGIAEATPFTFKVKYDNGTEDFDGFCIRLLKRIAKKMDFEYKLELAPGNSFGVKYDNGTWDGLIGDLVSGMTNIVIAALTMTSEREEAIDFVAPHFDQSGIAIVMKKQEKEVSLFKFMSVLEPEVWWCILLAIVVTAIVLWLLDKYSPFSGQNKTRYPYECRKFTLVECFWFALTSITPQGGGEPPKAISGRILVAAYWLFVVLMLATFTANLAAFLTVERMQSLVTSLEELAKQSKINYTVVEGSSIEQYFKNMAGAEDDLYRVWKDMTLNTSVDQAKYRVWDYPIKEQYNRIYKVIKDSGMVANADTGFERVKNDKDGSFAFIHDAAEIKYEVYRRCDLIEVGDAFAEQPYAIAVQSGSHLQEEISKVLLELQKDRYFEQLYNEFWNVSARRECPNYEETEGITLQSLGGVFIATLVGLVIGMLTLVGEVVLSKKHQKSQVQVVGKNTAHMTREMTAIRSRIIHPRPRLAYRY